MAFPVEPTAVGTHVAEPTLSESKVADTVKAGTEKNSAAMGVLLADSKALARKIVGATQHSEYYRKYQPDYKIQNTLLGEPSNRKIRVINVGTGLFSINLAYYISTTCQNFELTLFEKSSNLGGVWNHNQYPGIACDVPSHIYQYSWAPNPDWPRFLSPGDQIRDYLERVCSTFDLKKYMQFNTEVMKAEWIDEGFWRVTVREKQEDGSFVEYQKEAEVLVNNSGTQHKYQWPKVEGLDEFAGKLMHTASWDKSFNQEAWKDKTVCVIGSGASAVQVVPQLQASVSTMVEFPPLTVYHQPHVKKLVVFSRTPIWFAPGLAGDDFSPEYSEEQKQEFRTNPLTLINHSKAVEKKLNSLFKAFYHGTETQEKMVTFLHQAMVKKIRDPKLLEGFTPEFAPGCRRITPGDPFIYALQEPNVEVAFESVTRLTKDGVIDAEGVERKCDAVVCATGFNVDFTPPFGVYGKNGIALQDIFAEKQDNYMGLALPEFPNYYSGSGPYWTTANGSLIDPMNTASRYVVQVIQKLQVEHNILGVYPTKQALDEWVQHAQTWVKGMVWSGDCPAWYKIQSGPFAGRTNAVWPGITLHFVQAMKQIRWEDYHIERKASGQTTANRFQYLGHGLCKESEDLTLDDTPHFSLSAIDPRWTKAAGLTWIPGMQLVEEVQVNGFH